MKIDLIVRGVCALRPGMEGLSENIRVRSIIGRFLEHTRIFYFRDGGAEDVYLSSADWMDRNFFRRIELCFPVLDPKLKRRVIREGLQAYLDDNGQAWEMDGEGVYVRKALVKTRLPRRRSCSSCWPARTAARSPRGCVRPRARLRAFLRVERRQWRTVRPRAPRKVRSRARPACTGS